MKVGGYGGFRERLVLKNDGERMKKLGIYGGEVGHGRATTGTGRANTGTGRANLLECWVGFGM